MSGMPATDEARCVLGAVLADGSWLWLAHQSDASLAALNEALPIFLAEPRRLILDEMVDWIAQLRLPADLLGLYAHYGLGRPEAGLVALRTRLAEELQQ